MDILSYIVVGLIAIKVMLNLRLSSRYQRYYSEDVVDKGGRPSFKAIDSAIRHNINDVALHKDLKGYRKLLLVSFWLSIVIFILVIIVISSNVAG